MRKIYSEDVITEKIDEIAASEEGEKMNYLQAILGK